MPICAHVPLFSDSEHLHYNHVHVLAKVHSITTYMYIYKELTHTCTFDIRSTIVCQKSTFDTINLTKVLTIWVSFIYHSNILK